MTTNALARKLLIRAGNRVALLNAPEGYASKLEPLPDGAELGDDASGGADVILLFVSNIPDILRLGPRTLDEMRPGCVLWVAYPKQGTMVGPHVSQDEGWDPLLERGWRPVTPVSVDHSWSALRFRPMSEVST